MDQARGGAARGRALELAQRTTHGGYTGALADNMMAVTCSGYTTFAQILFHIWFDGLLCQLCSGERSELKKNERLFLGVVRLHHVVRGGFIHVTDM